MTRIPSRALRAATFQATSSSGPGGSPGRAGCIGNLLRVKPKLTKACSRVRKIEISTIFSLFLKLKKNGVVSLAAEKCDFPPSYGKKTPHKLEFDRLPLVCHWQ